MSVNKAILIGRLGSDPEVRYTQGGSAVANFNMATSEQYTDKSGQRQEKTEWHRIVAWGRLGEICGQHLKKGRQVFVEGSIQTREWQDRDGNKRYTTEIKATTVQFLGGRGESDGGPARGNQGGYGGGQGGYGGPQGGQGGYGGGQGGPQGGPGGYGGDQGGYNNGPGPAPAGPQGGEFNDDDIPF